MSEPLQTQSDDGEGTDVGLVSMAPELFLTDTDNIPVNDPAGVPVNLP